MGAKTTDYSANLLNQYDLIGSYEPVYDADGNLLSDLQHTYTWNAENRLILVEPIVAMEGSTRVEFTYDYLGRRVKKTVWVYETGSWTEESVTAFVYDGWNVVEEVSNTGSDSVGRIYTWGLDLSGSLQGAGGVGGLLAQSRTDSSDTQTYYYTYDFNGNVSELLDASGSIAAHYEYGAFGELIRSIGAFADENTFRFSTKYTDPETGLLYYGYRYYDPVTGRWPSRDPLQERGGTNLYGFVGNDGVNYVDRLGLDTYAIDGTWANITNLAVSNFKETNVGDFVKRLDSSEFRRYYGGPGANLNSGRRGGKTYNGATGSETYEIVKDVWKDVCDDWDRAKKDGRDFNINIVGWSRGAIASIWLAKELGRKGCKCGSKWVKMDVNFLGLYDAVEMIPDV
jgi:RHS repeat-associated protein